MTQERLDAVRAAFEAALLYAVTQAGVDAFKRTSLFGEKTKVYEDA